MWKILKQEFKWKIIVMLSYFESHIPSVYLLPLVIVKVHKMFSSILEHVFPEGINGHHL